MKLLERFFPKPPGTPLSVIPGLAKEYEQYVIDNRRLVHTYAELAGQEVKTSALIRREAEKLGLGVEQVTATGLLVTLDTGRPGNGVALRADMDALPIAEHPENMKCSRSVVSENPATCHACGHDAHVAMLLGAMQILCRMKDSLRGRIYFCFEEGEETSTGWGGMVEALEQRPVNTAFALHVSSALESGKVSLDPGPRMGGMIVVDATFHGRGGHGSRPDLSINPVFAAAAALNDLAVAFANQMNPDDPVTLGITSIVGGGTMNVFPDTARILGSMRFFSVEAGKKALAVTNRVLEHSAAMHLCRVEYDPAMRVMLLPTVNDADAAKLGCETLAKVLPKDALTSADKWYGSESFSQYLARYKGAFGFLGTRNEALGTTAAHHNEHFDLDESALILGTMSYAAYAAEACSNAAVSGWGYHQPPETTLFAEEPSLPHEPADQPAPVPASSAKYGLDTKIGVLLKSEAAKAAVEQVVPGVANHPQIHYVKGISIRKAAQMAPNLLPKELLAKLEEALAQVTQ